VELHALVGAFAVADPHDDLALVVGPGSLVEDRGQVVALDRQRVVPAGAEGLGEVREPPRPSWRTVEGFPWTTSGAWPTRAPWAAQSAWWPRQTPSVGYARSRNTGMETPASAGVPGPGETTMPSGSSARIASTSTASLRRTTTSPCSGAPTADPTYWTRLYANES